MAIITASRLIISAQRIRLKLKNNINQNYVNINRILFANNSLRIATNRTIFSASESKNRLKLLPQLLLSSNYQSRDCGRSFHRSSSKSMVAFGPLGDAIKAVKAIQSTHSAVNQWDPHRGWQGGSPLTYIIPAIPFLILLDQYWQYRKAYRRYDEYLRKTTASDLEKNKKMEQTKPEVDLPASSTTTTNNNNNNNTIETNLDQAKVAIDPEYQHVKQMRAAIDIIRNDFGEALRETGRLAKVILDDAMKIRKQLIELSEHLRVLAQHFRIIAFVALQELEMIIRILAQKLDKILYIIFEFLDLETRRWMPAILQMASQVMAKLRELAQSLRAIAFSLPEKIVKIAEHTFRGIEHTAAAIRQIYLERKLPDDLREKISPILPAVNYAKEFANTIYAEVNAQIINEYGPHARRIVANIRMASQNFDKNFSKFCRDKVETIWKKLEEYRLRVSKIPAAIRGATLRSISEAGFDALDRFSRGTCEPLWNRFYAFASEIFSQIQTRLSEIVNRKIVAPLRDRANEAAKSIINFWRSIEIDQIFTQSLKRIAATVRALRNAANAIAHFWTTNPVCDIEFWLDAIAVTGDKFAKSLRAFGEGIGSAYRITRRAIGLAYEDANAAYGAFRLAVPVIREYIVTTCGALRQIVRLASEDAIAAYGALRAAAPVIREYIVAAYGALRLAAPVAGEYIVEAIHAVWHTVQVIYQFCQSIIDWISHHR